ncbi:hypothetical protein D9613_006231 [Agrocybe pediades]|uniref:YTH domain-containing protein n=1 Tax=Agrocybe pediades TaxID=84607 RepID=A0A8H4QUN0_9AGAR|nr:hypothetical protein D9613_006231 [Agrocybe pediades]
MVEAKLETPPLLSATPTSMGRERTGYFEPCSGGRTEDSSPYSTDPGRNSSPLDEITTPLSFDSISSSGDATLGMSDPSKPPPTSRRRPRLPQQSSSVQRQQPATQSYPISPPPTEIHNRPHSSFQGSPIHYASYPQRTGFVGQYTLPTQPAPINIVHSQPYTYSHSYHPIPNDGNPMVSHSQQNIHAMLQPHAPVFHYQGHSSDGTPSPHQPPFTGSRTSPMYPSNTPSSPTSPHLPSSSGQSGPLTPSYIGPTQFHSLLYPPTISSTAYAYQPQSYSTTPPMFQAQYAPSHFTQHYASTAETEPQPQGAWYFLTHTPGPTPPPQPQYDAGTSYQGHYAVAYPQAGQGGLESGYGGFYPFHVILPSHQVPALQPHGGGGGAQQSQQLFAPSSSDLRTPSSESAPAAGIGPPFIRGGGSVFSPPPSASSDSERRPNRTSDRPIVRRPYHPNPPANRSEWVMWAGNVPSDASHDELWRFFNAPPDNEPDTTTGVLSIFLISRSSCAFINYETVPYLQTAIARFNGAPLRANDPRCPRLVCRVRRKDDDLKAGVGGQRGMGMHTRWVREHMGKGKEVALSASEPSDLSDLSLSPTSISERMTHAVSNLSMSSDDESKHRQAHPKHSSSSGSYTSTNSSFLTKHFPKRYFILKSLTQEDLDISVEKSVWATQKHNEEILDQAFRSSQEVHLIFSVNKSGEFYGYARMAGPVRRGEDRTIPWATRPPTSPTRAVASHPVIAGQSSKPLPASFLSPSDGQRYVDNSPLPINVSTAGGVVQSQPDPMATGTRRAAQSAPAMIGPAYHLQTLTTPPSMRSLEQRRFDMMMLGGAGVGGPRAAQPGKEDGSGSFELDESAPLRAIRSPKGSSSSGGSSGDGGAPGRGAGAGAATGRSRAPPSLGSVQEEAAEDKGVQEQEDKRGRKLVDGEVDEAKRTHGASSDPPEKHGQDQAEGAGDGAGSSEQQQQQQQGPSKSTAAGAKPAATTEESWGDSFAVEWICTDRVPFHRVKHLRNPWNRDREIKISRDGTELEPTVGQRLLDEWHKLADPQMPGTMGAGKPTVSRRDRDRAAASGSRKS